MFTTTLPSLKWCDIIDDLEGQCRRYSLGILTCQGITLLFIVMCILTEMNCKVLVYFLYSLSHGICCLQRQVPHLNKCMKIGQHQLLKVKMKKLKVAAVKTQTQTAQTQQCRAKCKRERRFFDNWSRIMAREVDRSWTWGDCLKASHYQSDRPDNCYVQGFRKKHISRVSPV